MENATPKKSTIQRLITGLIIGFAALFLLIAGGLPLLMLIAVVVIIGSIEYVKILQHKGFYPSLKVILVVNTIFTVISFNQNLMAGIRNNTFEIFKVNIIFSNDMK